MNTMSRNEAVSSVLYSKEGLLTNDRRASWESEVMARLIEFSPTRAKDIQGDISRQRLGVMHEIGVSAKRAVFGLMPGSEFVSKELVSCALNDFISDYNMKGSNHRVYEIYKSREYQLKAFLLFKRVNYSWLSFNLNESEQAMNNVIEKNFLN